MKIVHIVNDATFGGAQTLVARLAAAWPMSDSVHLIVLSSEGPLSSEYSKAFQTVTYLGIRYRPSAAFGIWKVRKEIRKIAPDIVHSHLTQSDLVNALFLPFGLLKVSTVHTTGFRPSDPLATRSAARLVALLSRRFATVIACDTDASRHMRDLKYRTTEVVTITNGVATDEIPSPRACGNTLVNIARLHPMKGHNVLLAAFGRFWSEHPEWKLRLVGEGLSKENHRIRALIEATGASRAFEGGAIELCGPTDDVGAVLSQVDALVISSTYGEASPMVGLEAIAKGVPVIATDVGGSKEFVLNDALVAIPGSTEALLRSLDAFAALDASSRQALRASSHALSVERYSLSDRVDAYAECYRAAIRRKNTKKRSKREKV